MSKSPYGMQTRLIHLSGAGHGTPSVVSPIFQTSTFRLPCLAAFFVVRFATVLAAWVLADGWSS